MSKKKNVYLKTRILDIFAVFFNFKFRILEHIIFCAKFKLNLEIK